MAATSRRAAATALVVLSGLLLVVNACARSDLDVADIEDTTSTTESTSPATSTTTTTTPTSTTTTTTKTSPDPEPFLLTPDGLSGLAIGQGERQATGTGLLEPWQPGCPLGGDGFTLAVLSLPLEGSVHAVDNFIYVIFVTGGPVITQPGGVGIGMPQDAASDAFATAGLTMSVDESLVEMFGEYFYRVDDGGGAQVFGGTIDPDTGMLTSLATPFVPVCE